MRRIITNMHNSNSIHNHNRNSNRNRSHSFRLSNFRPRDLVWILYRLWMELRIDQWCLLLLLSNNTSRSRKNLRYARLGRILVRRCRDMREVLLVNHHRHHNTNPNNRSNNHSNNYSPRSPHLAPGNSANHETCLTRPRRLRVTVVVTVIHSSTRTGQTRLSPVPPKKRTTTSSTTTNIAALVNPTSHPRFHRKSRCC